MRSRPPARPAHLAGRRACLRACPPAACRSKPGSSRGRRCSARYAGCTGSEPASARQRPVTRTAAAPAARTAQRRSRPTAQSPDRSNGTLGARSIILFIVFLIFVRCVAGGDRCGAAFAEQRVAAAGANGEMRARRVGGDRLVQQPMRELVLEAVDREHGIDADVVEQWSRDVRVDAVLAIDGLEDELAHRLLNEAIAADPARPHLAVRTSGGYTLLRERGAAAIPAGDTPNEDQKNDEQDDG